MTRPQKYRKKPVVIEAVRNDGTIESISSILDWINGGPGAKGAATYDLTGKPQMAIYIDTLEGTMQARVGDWIIKGVNGEFYPCKPEIFAKTYEVADAAHALDDATVERAAQAFADFEGFNVGQYHRDMARAVLAAAVGGDGE